MPIDNGSLMPTETVEESISGASEGATNSDLLDAFSWLSGPTSSSSASPHAPSQTGVQSGSKQSTTIDLATQLFAPVKRQQRIAGASFVGKKNWLGTVFEVRDRSFVAKLEDLTGNEVDAQAEIYDDEVADFDRELLVPGGVFYLSVGQEREKSGQVKGTSIVRFRRVPRFTPEEVASAQERATSLLARLGLTSASGSQPE